MKIKTPLPMWEILPGALYQRGMMHDIPLEEKRAGLKALGITHSIAMAPTKPDPDLALLTEKGLHTHIHFPIPDSTLAESSISYLRPLAKELALEIANGNVVLTMCRAGRNRSALLSAFILCELGLSGWQAVQKVRLERPNALANDHFVDYLRSIK